MSVIIQDNFSTAAAKPIDDRYGPYNNVAAAKSAIPEVYRYKGLTVGVLNSGVVEEYWWANGVTDSDLVAKTVPGNVQSVTTGTGLQDIGTATNPIIEVDNTYVQLVDNLSTDVSADGTSDIKYPSVKAIKDYADGLVVGLLNDRGNWAAGASPGPYPSNPPATGSGPLGAILKGDIWFISTNGFLGTTAVSIGASVRALVDSPSPSTDADWDIIDAGLGFTPENISNKVSTGANVNADPTSTVKYPSVRALVEYVQTYAPAPTTPNLQAVTNVGASTTNSIAAQSFSFYDSSTSSYAALSCDTTGSPSRILIEDSYASPRLSLDTAGTDLTVWANTGSTQAVLEFNSVSGTQTYTFPNATGTIALIESLSGTSPVNYDTTTGVISMSAADASTDGYLTQGDWNIFNSKQNSLSGSGIVKSTSGVISYISGTAPQFVKGDGSLDSTIYLSSSLASTTYVPYTGATTNVNLGTTIATGKNLYCSSIGIGTNSVSGRLHISSQGDGGGDINVLFTQGIVNSIISTGVGPNGMTIGTTANFNTYVQAGGLKVITVTSSPNYNVGIGTTTPNASAILELNSTTQGFLPPRMNTTNRNAISSPATGLIVYDTTENVISLRDNSSWKTIVSGSGVPNNLFKWSGTNTATNSQIYDNGTSVGIGTNSPSAAVLLQVEGIIAGNTTRTYAAGATVSTAVGSIQSNVKYNFGGNATIPNSVVTSSQLNVSTIEFTGTGTVTQSQAGLGGIRALSNGFLQWNFVGTNSGTVTHMANLRLSSPYSTSSSTLTVNNYYALLIEGSDQFSPAIAPTNKYGIYQYGANDTNYFEGKIGIGTNAPVASAKVQIDSTTQGFLPPRMTEAQRNLISSPPTGLMIYQTDGINGEGIYVKRSDGWNKLAWYTP